MEGGDRLAVHAMLFELAELSTVASTLAIFIQRAT